MSIYWIYLLKANIALAMFYGFYRLFYKNDTFFGLRRFTLMAIMVISLFYPFADLTLLWAKSKVITEVATVYVGMLPMVEVSVQDESSLPLTWQEVMIWLYVGLSLFFVIRLAVQLLRLLWMRWRCSARVVMNETVYCIPGKETPFSFFRWVFVNPSLHSEEELKEILEHELTHVSQHHSADVILYELLVVVCWFNPFVWMLRREMRKNLEFLADRKVVNRGFDLKSYQYHLLRLSHQAAYIPLSNQINVSPLKERIMMMNKRQSPKIKLAAYTLLFPFALLFLIANNAEAIVSSIPIVDNVVEKSGNVDSYPFKGTLMFADKTPVQGANVVIKNSTRGTVSNKEGHVDIEVADGDVLCVSYIGQPSIEFPINQAIIPVLVDGSERVSMTFSPPNNRMDEIVVVAYAPDANYEMRRQVSQSPDKKSSGQSTSESSSQSSSKSTSTQDQVFTQVEQMPEFPGGEGALLAFLAQNTKYPAAAAEAKLRGRVICSFVIDKEGKVKDVKIEQGISPEIDQEAMRVVKLLPKWTPGKQRGQAVSVKYVVPVFFGGAQKTSSTKPAAPTANAENAVFTKVEEMPQFPGGEEALLQFIAQNIKYPKEAIEAKEEGRVISSFVVTKEGVVSDVVIERGISASLDQEALRILRLSPKWTPGKQRGVPVAVKFVVPVFFRLDRVKSPQKITALVAGDQMENQPLVVIDGKESDKGMEDLDPDKIDKIDVLRSESAIVQYGEKARNGVLLITLKK